MVGFNTWRPDFVIVRGAAGVEWDDAGSSATKFERPESLSPESSAFVRFRLGPVAFNAAAPLPFLGLLSEADALAGGAFAVDTFPDAVKPLLILLIALPLDLADWALGRGMGIESAVESFGVGDEVEGICRVIEAEVAMFITTLLRTSS